jgi:hypothetical protein
MRPAGLGTETDCACEVQQQPINYRPTLSSALGTRLVVACGNETYM